MGNTLNISTIFESLDHCREDACEDCQYLHHFVDRVPYGGTTVSITEVECRCTDANQCEQASIYFEDSLIDFEETNNGN